MVSSDVPVATPDLTSRNYSDCGSSRNNANAGTFSKLRHTLTTGLQGTVTKLTPARGTTSNSNVAASSAPSGTANPPANVSCEERSLLQRVWDKNEKYEPITSRLSSDKPPPPISTPTAPAKGSFFPLNLPMNSNTTDNSSGSVSVPSKPHRPSSSSCRVCVKLLSNSEYFKKCSECSQKVCEDCASYSAEDDSQEPWHCSICKRKLLSKNKKTSPDVSSLMEGMRDSSYLTPFNTLDSCTTSTVNQSYGIKSVQGGPLSSKEDRMQIRKHSMNDLKFKEQMNHTMFKQRSLDKPSLMDNNNRIRSSVTSSSIKKDIKSPSSIKQSASNTEMSKGTSEGIDVRNIKSRTKDHGYDAQQGPKNNEFDNTSLTSPDVQSTTTEGSSDDRSPDAPRGRRKSIVRQKSYDEDNEDSSFLTLWSTNQLPIRRHSAQDPRRRAEYSDMQKKESLDVPVGKVQRHHSWDYEILKGTAQAKEHNILNLNESQLNKLNGRNSIKDESTVPSRGISSRRTSYRAIRNSQDNGRPKDYTQYTEDYTQSTKEKTTTSSLEEAIRFYAADEDARYRRKASAASDGGRVLPTPPASPRMPSNLNWTSGGSSGGEGRSSQSFESVGSREKRTEITGRQGSIADGEAIKIIINDVDTGFTKDSSNSGLKEEYIEKKVTVKREANGDMGMRIVGGKEDADGNLYTYVVWTVKGGPAECAGVRQGDKVLKWNKISLVNKSFEDVNSILEADESKQTIELLLAAPPYTFSSETVDDHGSEKADVPQTIEELEKSLSSYSKRKLPRVPTDSEMHRSAVSGKIQVQMWYDVERMNLFVNLLAATDLRLRDDKSQPEPFACARLFPYGDSSSYTTTVSEPTTKPQWNSSFMWENMNDEALFSTTLEISVWDSVDSQFSFLGECLIDLRHGRFDKRPVWHRLQERISRSANTTPRGSLAGYEFGISIARRSSSVKTGSDECHEDSRHSSMDSGFLHPDLAYRDSRRGSSLSEQAETEVYQLNRSYPHSLPQSRRSSFSVGQASPEFRAEDLEMRLITLPVTTDQRRAHSMKVETQQELLQEGGWKDLNQMPRWLSHSTNFHFAPQSRNYNQISQTSYDNSPRSFNRSNSLKEEHKLKKGALRNIKTDNEHSWRTTLGPGQVVPRAYRAILTDDFTLGELRLELNVNRGVMEIEVSNAKGILGADSTHPPDTYVKMYLKEGEKKLMKKKTRVIRQCHTPNFYQTLRYPYGQLFGRTLLVMVWEKTRGFEPNNPLGVAEIAVNKLELQRPVTGWYRLLPISSVERAGESDSD